LSDPTAEQIPKIRAWIQSEAKKALAEIQSYVLARANELYAAVNAVSEESLLTQLDEDWSPIDALKHLVEWNWQVGEDVLHVSLMGTRPANPPPVFEADRAGLIVCQRESLDSVWAHVSAADPASFLDLTWPHPFFGELNWREWYFFIGVHCYDHTGQIKTMHESLSA
jgi:hypothetical protein